MPQQSSIEAESQSQQLGVDLANGAGMPVQLINLGDGTAFIPIGNAPFFPLSEEANSPGFYISSFLLNVKCFLDFLKTRWFEFA